MSKKDSIPKGGHFKEFDSTIKAIESIQKYSASMTSADVKAFSDNFQKYVDSQPPEISVGLKDVYEAGKKEVEIVQDNDSTFKAYPSDMANLRALHAQLEHEQASLNAKVAAEKKAKTAAQKAEEKLSAARSKSSPDVPKLETEAQNAHQQAEEAQRAVESGQSDYNTYFDEYKKKFIDALCTNLSALADSRLRTLNDMSSAADAISSGILKVHDYSDPQVDSLKARLQEIETIVVE